MSFLNRRKKRIVTKADPLLSIENTDYANASIDQLRAEAQLLNSIANNSKKNRKDPVSKQSIEKAQDFLIRYCKERRVRIKREHRDLIIENVALIVDSFDNPPEQVSSNGSKRILSDKCVFANIDWLLDVWLKDF